MRVLEGEALLEHVEGGADVVDGVGRVGLHFDYGLLLDGPEVKYFYKPTKSAKDGTESGAA